MTHRLGEGVCGDGEMGGEHLSDPKTNQHKRGSRRGGSDYRNLVRVEPFKYHHY